MSNALYTVTLNDLGTYRVTVAANSPQTAEQVAKSVLFEEATRLPDDLEILSREVQATVELATTAAKPFTVRGYYRLQFSLTVPAESRSEAEIHAKRLYDHHCGPYDFDIDEDHVGPFTAREVAQ